MMIGRSRQIAKSLGISDSWLRNWMAQADADEKGGDRLASAEKKGAGGVAAPQ